MGAEMDGGAEGGEGEVVAAIHVAEDLAGWRGVAGPDLERVGDRW